MKMDERDVMDRVKKVLVEEFDLKGENLTAQSALYEEMGLDSLDSVDLVVALEKEFGFKVVRVADEERIRAIRLLKDVCDFVAYKLSHAAAAPNV